MKSIDEIAGKMQDDMGEKKRLPSDEVLDTIADLPGKPDCAICLGKGCVRLDVPLGDPRFGKLYPCPCRVADIQNARAEMLRSLSNLDILERFTFERFHPEGHGLSPERQQNLRSAYERQMS